MGESRERYRIELSSLRLEVANANSLQNEQISGMLARQIEVMRRIDRLEQQHLRAGME